MFEMSTSPLVSIVMPTYNRAGLIAETIESIQQQTYRNWELIIVDDGSVDNTADIIENIHDDRIRYYKTQHLGMERARKTGLDKSNGELIGFMDSDDLWATTKLENSYIFLRNTRKLPFA